MTRRELREHCFKLLFCADFYPEGETKEQMEEYFTEPVEEVSAPAERVRSFTARPLTCLTEGM